MLSPIQPAEEVYRRSFDAFLNALNEQHRLILELKALCENNEEKLKDLEEKQKTLE